MTYATDITLNGRGARLMRAAFALGALALVALALSACTPSPEQIAARAKDKMFEDKIEAVNLDRIRRATSLTIAHCPAILSREPLEGAPAPDIALRVAARDLTAQGSDGSGLGTADALNPVRPLSERGIATAPEIFHDDANPVKVGDTVRHYVLYKTGIHITSTLR